MHARHPMLLGLWLLLAACTTTVDPGATTAANRSVLAPSGALRVSLYRGSPSSIVEDAAGRRGVGYDLGEALAKRLDVRFEPIVFPNNAEALAAVRDGKADIAFTNASPARAKDMDFSATFIDVEKGFLVPPGSSATFAGMRRKGVRIGVSAGSTTAGEVGELYPDATFVTVATLAAGVEMLRDGRLDAFATNKAILFEMSDSLPGSRVLEGRWGAEHFAAGIPKGRDAGRAYVDAFVRDAVRDGTVAAAVRRAGMRGVTAGGS